MSRSPNPEQKLAIEHTGGVILRAGAGSGKTFVLVEHIVYLTQNWISEYKASKSPLSFEEFIRSKYVEVVMMTFTKKAAGEMSIRLSERFASIVEAISDDAEYWSIANQNLALLMVTTIDGFCRKLITAGYFPNLSTEAKVINDSERKEQVYRLVERWYEENQGSISESVLEIILKEQNKILDAFCKIFADPAIRLAWRNFKLSDCSVETTEQGLLASFKLNKIDEALSFISNVQLSDEKEHSAFEKSIFQFQILGDKDIDSIERLDAYYRLISSSSRLSPEMTAKKKSPEYTMAHEQRKILADWVKEWHGACDNFLTHLDDKVLPWMKALKNIFEFVDQSLDPNLGMTFGDIEYFVNEGLSNLEYRERVLKQYRYFIVDEFQDTSLLQFNIIQKLLNNNYKNFFCVGDAKQAIYGFRGGTLDVFNQAKTLLRDLTLANNYRSLPEIIRFNNSLFKTLLPLGENYQELDPFTVEFEEQQIPESVAYSEKGIVEILKLDIPTPEDVDKFKISTDAINKLEAKIIALDILESQKTHPHHISTVLYSTLKPSNDLIKNLIDLEIGFTAQYKIDLLEEPIVGIFVALLRRKFDTKEESRDQFPITLLNLYFKILHAEVLVDEKMIQDFDLAVEYWGLLEGFKKFLFNLGITNENADINLDVIEGIALLYNQNAEGMLLQMTKGSNERLSLDLRIGKNADKVQIMSSHASKGLEFDTVYLGGIYTNGKGVNDSLLLGKRGLSFKWYSDLSQKEVHLSPVYLYENEKQKLLEFSELKRLFYVACTRAQKQLKFVQLETYGAFKAPKNSWSAALDFWMDSQERISVNDVLFEKNIDLDPFEIINAPAGAKLPLFFYDSMGIHQKVKGSSELLIAAELSVTRLNSLIDCPRKYYLENILKLKPSTQNIPAGFIPVNHPDDSDEVAAQSSSSERGTYIHAQISRGIERNFIVPLEDFHTEHREPLSWILDLLSQQRQGFEFISEKSVKFRFFNFMISGIPDLIMMSKVDGHAQIWDFKTGRLTEEKLKHYWVQLKAYAYGLFILGRVECSSEIVLKLAFVDEKRIIEEKIGFEQCREDLYPLWLSQREPWKVNLDHCSQCPYGDICPR